MREFGVAQLDIGSISIKCWPPRVSEPSKPAALGNIREKDDMATLFAASNLKPMKKGAT